MVLPPWSSGDQPLAIGTSLMAATATEDFMAAVVDELKQAVDRLSNPLYRRALRDLGRSRAFNLLNNVQHADTGRRVLIEPPVVPETHQGR